VDFLHRLVEERIEKAQREGVFDDLPGKGKPLKLDDDSSIPEDLRMTYKILKNSGCLPIEMELKKQIFSLRQLLDASIDPEVRKDLRRQLNLLILDFNLRRRRSATLDLPQW
jgi:DnaJ-like protein